MVPVSGVTEAEAAEAELPGRQVTALVRTIRREDLNAVDRAQALRRLRVTLGLASWREVGDLVGFTRQHVNNLLNVTRLPEQIREDIRAGDLTERQARSLRRLHSHPDQQIVLWERIHAERLSGRAADTAARSMGVPARPGAPRHPR